LKTIARVLNFDDHIDSDKPNAISTTTLMGPMYKGQLYLDKTEKTYQTDLVLKRSSFLGTAAHNRMEYILKTYGDEYKLEGFGEREIIVDGVTYVISGSFDVLEKTEEGKYIIMDLKTFYGKERKPDQLKKDALQMSIYRWIFAPLYDIEIEDRAWTLAISQSNNYIDEIAVELLSLDATQDYIENKLFAIAQNQKVDCKEGVKYNTCNYCEYMCEERS